MSCEITRIDSNMQPSEHMLRSPDMSSRCAVCTQPHLCIGTTARLLLHCWDEKLIVSNSAGLEIRLEILPQHIPIFIYVI